MWRPCHARERIPKSILGLVDGAQHSVAVNEEFTAVAGDLVREIVGSLHKRRSIVYGERSPACGP